MMTRRILSGDRVRLITAGRERTGTVIKLFHSNLLVQWDDEPDVERTISRAVVERIAEEDERWPGF